MDRRKEQQPPMGDSALITEKRFALSYNSFWSSLIPMASRYLRRQNASLATFCEPMTENSNDNRGVINELGFRLFCVSATEVVPGRNISSSSVKRETDAALSFIRRFRQFSRTPVDSPTPAAVEEARTVGDRIGIFVEAMKPQIVIPRPAFPGCGWLDACEGDLLLDRSICEIKAGSGRFRGRDLRQVLTYAALNRAAASYPVDSVCLVNPRLGVLLSTNLDHLCFELAGTNAASILADIVDYLSQTHWRDEAV